jgi:hypothetical protein
MMASDWLPPTFGELSLGAISNLPEEILLNIFHHIRNWDGTRDTQALARLCSVNRRFQRLATPLAYETFDTCTGSLYKFMRTLLKTPKLCEFLKNVVWGYNVHRTLIWDHERGLNTLVCAQGEDVSDKAFIIEKLSVLDMPRALSIASYYENLPLNGILTPPGFLLEVLILLASHVESIAYQTNGGHEEHGDLLWLRLIEYGSAHGFKDLHELKITLTSCPEVPNLRLLPLFTHQPLRVLDLDSFVCPTNVAVLPASCSNIEVIKVRQSLVYTPVLALLIRACRRLKVFLYEQWYIHDTRESWRRHSISLVYPKPSMIIEELDAALNCHRKTLQHLAIPAYGHYSNGCGYFNPFNDFEVLKTVLLPTWALSPSIEVSRLSLRRLPFLFSSSVDHIFLDVSAGSELREDGLDDLFSNPLIKSLPKLCLASRLALCSRDRFQESSRAASLAYGADVDIFHLLPRSMEIHSAHGGTWASVGGQCTEITQADLLRMWEECL